MAIPPMSDLFAGKYEVAVYIAETRIIGRILEKDDHYLYMENSTRGLVLVPHSAILRIEIG